MGHLSLRGASLRLLANAIIQRHPFVEKCRVAVCAAAAIVFGQKRVRARGVHAALLAQKQVN